MPSRDDVELMVNGGCVFYQFGSHPYVYGLGLKTGNEGKVLQDEDLPHLIGWFSRFADLLTLTSYKQTWYKDIIVQFELHTQQYIKSFFTILANIAFCSLKYEDPIISRVLTAKFKDMLQFEIDRDYKKELEEQFDFERIIKELEKAPNNEKNADQ